MNWKQVRHRPPEENVEVLAWAQCMLCLDNVDHGHKLGGKQYMEAFIATWCPPDLHAIDWYLKTTKDHPDTQKRFVEENNKHYWSPYEPTHWAYIEPPK
jgi:hypothetical protein